MIVRKLLIFLLVGQFVVSCVEEGADSATAESNDSNYTELVNEGLELLKAQKPEESLSLFNQAIKMKGDSIRGYYGRAYAYTLLCDMGSADCQKAIEHWGKVEAIDSCFRNTGYNKAVCFTHIGEREMAINYYTKALECGKDDPDIYFNRGMNRLFVGDTTGYCIDMTNGYGMVDDTIYLARKELYHQICGENLGLDLKDGMSVKLEFGLDLKGMSVELDLSDTLTGNRTN